LPTREMRGFFLDVPGLNLRTGPYIAAHGAVCRLGRKPPRCAHIGHGRSSWSPFMHTLSVSAAEHASQVRPDTVPIRPEVARDLSVGTLALIEGYRRYGYRRASINPLDESPRDLSLLTELDPRTYGLSVDEPHRYSIDLGGVAHLCTLSELLERL